MYARVVRILLSLILCMNHISSHKSVKKTTHAAHITTRALIYTNRNIALFFAFITHQTHAKRAEVLPNGATKTLFYLQL